MRIEHRTNLALANQRRRRRGFTYFELVLGMLITSLVMASLAALLGAVGQGWMQSETAQDTSNTLSMTNYRVLRILRSAKQIGAVRTGSIEGGAGNEPAVMLWKGDANGDGLVQFSEVALLTMTTGATPADCKLMYYDVSYPSTWTTAQKTAADTPALASDNIYQDASIDTFKALMYVRATPLARDVVGAEFHKYDGANVVRPYFDYMLNFQFGNSIVSQYGTVAVRTPATMPSSQTGG